MRRPRLSNIAITNEDRERFWRKVDKTDGCWLWTASAVKGYGEFTFNGRGYKAHRVAYLLSYGECPEHMLVCHSCDVPLCVNPSHLFLGTVKMNAQDAAIKGRCAHTKLNPEIVRQLRTECVPGSKDAGYSALARKYGCNPGAIWQAVNRTRWEHVE